MKSEFQFLDEKLLILVTCHGEMTQDDLHTGDVATTCSPLPKILNAVTFWKRIIMFK